MPKVLIEKHKDGEFRNVEAFTAFTGFSKLDWECDFTAYSHLPAYLNAVNAEYDCAVGTADFVRAVMTLQKIQIPNQMDYIDHGNHYLYLRWIYKEFPLDRAISFKYKELGQHIFVKPAERKDFYSAVIRNDENLKQFYGLNHDLDIANTYCWMSMAIDILSEWRLYVYDKKIIQACCYAGDFEVPLFLVRIKNFIAKDFENAPIAYVIDVATFFKNDGTRDTAVIEFNDFIHIGNYGLEDELYAKCCAARWEEIRRGEKIRF